MVLGYDRWAAASTIPTQLANGGNIPFDGLVTATGEQSDLSVMDTGDNAPVPAFAHEKEKIESLLDTYHPSSERDFRGNDSLGESLKQNLSDYTPWFNTLPPQLRIIISRIGVNAPITIPELSKPIEEINEWEFDEELYKWVVKYPTTAIPWSEWNTLLFGHTSYEERKHNPYATVFRSIPKLQDGDIISLIRWGKVLKYRVINKTVVKPSWVNQEFLKYHNQWGKFLTLMGCYPVGTSEKRLMVVAELIDG